MREEGKRKERRVIKRAERRWCNISNEKITQRKIEKEDWK